MRDLPKIGPVYSNRASTASIKGEIEPHDLAKRENSEIGDIL